MTKRRMQFVAAGLLFGVVSTRCSMRPAKAAFLFTVNLKAECPGQRATLSQLLSCSHCWNESLYRIIPLRE
jgi:hypothetical protein